MSSVHDFMTLKIRAKVIVNCQWLRSNEQLNSGLH